MRHQYKPISSIMIQNYHKFSLLSSSSPNYLGKLKYFHKSLDVDTHSCFSKCQQIVAMVTTIPRAVGNTRSNLHLLLKGNATIRAQLIKPVVNTLYTMFLRQLASNFSAFVDRILRMFLGIQCIIPLHWNLRR